MLYIEILQNRYYGNSVKYNKLLVEIVYLKMRSSEGVVTIHFGEKNTLRAMIKALKSHGNFSKVFKVSPMSHILHLLVKIVYLKMRSTEVVVLVHSGEKNELKAMIKALKSQGNFS